MMAHSPQRYDDKLAFWLLDRFHGSTMTEGFNGDIKEEFEALAERKGSTAARLWLWRHAALAGPKAVMQSLRGEAERCGSDFRLALRNLRRHRVFSIINMAGMALSLSLAMMVIQFLTTLLSADEFHEHKERLYQVYAVEHQPEGGHVTTACAPLALGPTLADACPGIAHVVRLKKNIRDRALANGKALHLAFSFSDPDFFKVFSFPLKWGDAATALKAPRSIVLTESVAHKFFQDANPVGEIFQLDQFGDFTVTGVMHDEAHLNSQHILRPMVSMSTLQSLAKEGESPELHNNWERLRYHALYILLDSPGSLSGVKDFLRDVAARYPQTGTTRYTYEIQRFCDLLPPTPRLYIEKDVSVFHLSVLGGIAVLILGMAAFNYTNLSLARILSRAREVGIRKVVGGRRGQIYAQFTLEAVALSLVSLMLAYGIYRLLLIPLFYGLYDEFRQVFSFHENWRVLAAFVGLSLLTGVIAGFLPAVTLARFRILDALHDLKGKRGGMRVRLRKFMVISQFAMTLICVVAMASSMKQSRHARRLDLGFNPTDLYILTLQGANASTLMPELQAHPAILSVSASSSLPGALGSYTTVLRRVGEEDSLRVQYLLAGPRFVQTLQFSMKAGQAHPQVGEASPTQWVYLSESAMSSMGFESPQEAVGALIRRDGERTPLRVAGVLADYIHGLVTSRRAPSAIIVETRSNLFAQVRIRPGSDTAVLAFMREVWERGDSAEPLEWQRYQDRIEQSLIGMDLFMKLLLFVAVLTVAVSLLGIVGIADYSAKSRIKEVGIRKVLGAGEWRLLYTLCSRFLLMIFIAGILAAPVAFVAVRIMMTAWGNPSPVDWPLIFLTFIGMGVFGLVAVLSQTLRTARSNPVETLKYE